MPIEREHLDWYYKIQGMLRTITDQLKPMAVKLAELEVHPAVPHRDHTKHRAPVPSLSGYDPERTPMGGIRLDPAMWEQFAGKLSTMQARLDAVETEKALAESRAAGAQDAIRSLVRTIKMVVAIGGPVLAGLSGLAVHFLKL